MHRITKLGLTEGSFSAQTEPRLSGRYHDGAVRCFETTGSDEESNTGTERSPLNKRQVLDIVAAGRQESLECSGVLLATYAFSNANYWLDFQANISDALTKTPWEPPDTQRLANWRRRQLRGETGPRIGRRPPAELLQEYHEVLLDFHEDALMEAGYSRGDIDPPTWGYQGNWNNAEFLVRCASFRRLPDRVAPCARVKRRTVQIYAHPTFISGRNFRNFSRGRIVAKPAAGWHVSAGGASLLDETSC
eukprot:COSAG02_NODE_6914_length_3291_cov_5.102444_3_plen_248_part_00